MKKFILLGILMLFLVRLVSATTNLDFRIDVEDRAYYPNEEVPLTITIINRDTSISAKEAELTIKVGQRFYSFDIGDLKPGDIFEKEITLPEFPAATHSLQGVINYTGILGARFSEMSYGSFEVLFPPIERYPRNVYVSDYSIPEKIFDSQLQDISATIKNDGKIDARILFEFGSIDEFESEETLLLAGQSITLKKTIKFENSGIQFIEVRAYALINGEKYLLNYAGKGAYVQTERKAKLSFDRLVLVDEPGNKINQNDRVKLKIYIRNEGDIATNVRGTIISNIENVSVLDSEVFYNVIVSGDAFAPENDIFEIETLIIEAKDDKLMLELLYTDSENMKKELEIPLTIAGGGVECTKSLECSETQACENEQCTDINCIDGYIENYQCIKYECIIDSDCENYYTCDQELHMCTPPRCTNNLQCEDNEICSAGTCHNAFTVVAVPLGFSENSKNNFFNYAERELTFFRDISPLRESNIEGKNLRVHYVDPSICSETTLCTWSNDRSCSREIVSCIQNAGLIGIADKLVAVSNKPIGACGFAYIGGFWSVSLVGCSHTIAHEIGHQFDLEHIKGCGNPAHACKGPNAVDCNDPNFRTDVMSYCSPEDHYGPHAYKYIKKKYFDRILGDFI